MADKTKKPYAKARMRTTKIVLGVFGSYGGGEETQPNLPIGGGQGGIGLNLQD